MTFTRNYSRILTSLASQPDTALVMTVEPRFESHGFCGRYDVRSLLSFSLDSVGMVGKVKTIGTCAEVGLM